MTGGLVKVESLQVQLGSIEIEARACQEQLWLFLSIPLFVFL
jgi:hypothetical protein